MNLIYRTFQPGDEHGLADVFNHAFQSLGGGMLRTPKTILWRYIQRPGGKPEEIQIAVDEDTHKIVGSVYSTIEHMIIKGKKVIAGAINDVSVLPSYQGHGIAQILMKQAISFMEKENCDISALCADPKGHPRKKMYLPLGWEDFENQIVSFKVASLKGFSKYLPIILPFLPALIVSHGLRSWMLQRYVKKMENRGYSIRLLNPPADEKKIKNLSPDIYEFISRVGPQEFDGSVCFSAEEWAHLRDNSIRKSLASSYIVITKDEKIIAIASFFQNWVYASKLGLHFPIAFVREFFVDKKGIKNLKLQTTLEYLLLGSLWKATKKRGCLALIFESIPQQNGILSVSKALGFIGIPASKYMIKPMKGQSIESLKSDKPFFVSPGEYTGYP